MAAWIDYNRDIGINGNGLMNLQDIKDKFIGNKTERKPAIATASSDEAVAKAVVSFSKDKADKLKSKLSVKKDQLKNEEIEFKEKEKHLITLKKTTFSLEEKYKSLTEKKRSELVSDYRQVVTKLKLHPMVARFEVDREKRIIVTTKMIKIQKEDWDKPKDAGIYQIRIDFSKEAISDAIHILNISWRFDSYDSPTINNTQPCWGNMNADIMNEFSSQDLYELVIDLIDYIASSNDKDGYLAQDGNKNKGWEQFFAKKKKQPDNYSFEKFDQDSKNGKIIESGLATEVTYGSVSVSTSISPSTSIASSMQVQYYGLSEMYPYPSMSAYAMRYNTELMEVLESNFGLVKDAAAYYSRIIMTEGDYIPVQIDLASTTDQFTLYVSRESQTREGRVDRFYLSEREISDNMLSQLRSGRVLRYRFSRENNNIQSFEGSLGDLVSPDITHAPSLEVSGGTLTESNLEQAVRGI